MAKKKTTVKTVKRNDGTVALAHPVDVEKDPKTDCFAYAKNDKGIYDCSALDGLYCKYGNCSFYKTREQYDAGLVEHPFNYACCAERKKEG